MNMNALPNEIMTKILDYLPFNDEKNVSLINTKWYHASLHPTLIKKQWFRNLQNDKVDIEKCMMDCNDFQQTLIKSKRTYFNLQLYFGQIHNNIDLSIFEGLGNRIMSLHLKYVTCFDGRFLNCITDGCTVLKSLTIEGTRMKCFNYNPCKLLLNLKSLTLNTVYLSDNIFNIIMQCCPNLENLGLLKCNISYCKSILEKLCKNDIWESITFDNTKIFTILSVISCLKKAKNINSLRIDDCLIFMCLPAHIKLKNLALYRHKNFDYSLIDIEKLILLLSKQVSLEELNIEYVPCCLLSAVSKLQNLKCLKVHFITDASETCDDEKLCVPKFVESLNNMKKLKELAIIPCDEEVIMTNLESFSSIPAIPDCTLRLLTSIDCFIENRLQIVQFSNNLKSLHIHNAEILISSDLHLIFNNFLNLEYLRLTNCINLNDSIFKELPVSNLKELISFQFDGNITYECLKYIKLLNLKYLRINNMSTKTKLGNNLSDFEESLKQFGSFVPALISFELCIRKTDFICIFNHNNYNKIIHYDLKPQLLPILKPYYKSLKKIVISIQKNCNAKS